jgi:hypothetical protein
LTLATLVALAAAAAGGMFTADLVSGHDAGPREAVHKAPAPAPETPSPRPLRNVIVHRSRMVTLTYQVSNHGTALRRVLIVIRKPNGSIAESLHLGPQAPDSQLSHRFRVTLKPAKYTWFVRATGANGVARTSARGGSLTVLGPLPRLLPSAASIDAAAAYLRQRDPDSALAVVDSRGGLHGYNFDTQFASASVIKAMLLVQYLRTNVVVPSDMEATLRLMITQSDNAAAFRVFAAVGAKGLYDLARLTGMKHLSVAADVIFSRVTAADQARFFYAMDDYIPPEHRALAHDLLSHVVPSQSWGVPQVARPDWTVFFKGGWIGPKTDPYTIVNQVARLERGKLKWSVAVLSDRNPHSPYGVATLEGVAQRLLDAPSQPQSD